jgi:hypothetical protein
MRALAVFVPLFAILAFAVWASVRMWSFMEGTQMSGHGYTAMFLGIFCSLAVGGGLMALMFYSSRRGWDDSALGEPSDESGDAGRDQP